MRAPSQSTEGVGLACTSDCTDEGSTQCGTDGVERCEDTDGDGCFEWGEAEPCNAPRTCTAGECRLLCDNACPAAGRVECVGGSTSQYRLCDDFDSNGCVEWGEASSCSGGNVCMSGMCVPE